MWIWSPKRAASKSATQTADRQRAALGAALARFLEGSGPNPLPADLAAVARALLAAYLSEYSGEGYDRETFLDWVATAVDIVPGDVRELIALFDRRATALKALFPGSGIS